MADCLPVASSGPREPVKRPKSVPKIVKDACLLMVYGDPDDEDAVPVDFISAAKTVGMRPDTLRRYLARPQVIAFLRAERRAFREAICAGNEGALRRVRDKSPNGMAVIGSVRALEQLTEEAAPGRPGQHPQAPGLWVVINAFTGKPPASTDAGPIVDVTPAGHEDEPTDPTVFRSPRW